MLPYKLHHFKSLTSTQDKAKEFSKTDLYNLVIIADAQTKGRGRFKRKWYSSKGSLPMSILLKPKNIQNLQYLTFAAAISVVKSIKKLTKLNVNIKWPNDVHYNGKKLCGILTEGIFGKESYVAVGIGLNVNQHKFQDEINNIATSLRIIKNQQIGIESLAKNIVSEFFSIYNNQYNKNKLKKILKSWKKYCDTINKKVVVISSNKIIKGKAINVDENCNLLLKSSSNKIIKIVEGDINVFHNL